METTDVDDVDQSEDASTPMTGQQQETVRNTGCQRHIQRLQCYTVNGALGTPENIAFFTRIIAL